MIINLNFNGKLKMEIEINFEKFNEPIIKKREFSVSNHKIFKKYSSELYQKYSFELLETLCNKSHFEHKTKILYSSMYFLLKFLYKSKNEVYIENYDLIILISFYLGIKTVENQKKIPNLKKFKNIYSQKFGNYTNKEIQESEIIYLKILEYKINFMTIYDYLIYLFNCNEEFILMHLKNINKIMKQNTIYFCSHAPKELIQEVTNNPKIYNIPKYPSIIQKKIIFKSRENSSGCEFGNNLEESLSTSISSGNQNNNFNILGNEQNNNINYKKLDSLKNYTSRKIESSFNKRYKKFNLNFLDSSTNTNYYNNLTINNNESLDKEKIEGKPIYNKKNVKFFKNNTTQKEANIKKNSNISKTNIKEKVFRSNNSTYNICFKNSNNKKLFFSNNKNVYVKPNIKKEEIQCCFTSNKKRDIESKCISFKKLNNKKEANDSYYKENLKKKLFFEENDYSE